MKKILFVSLSLLCACAKAPAPEGVEITQIRVFVDNKPVVIPTETCDRITSLSEVLGACVKKDLSVSRVLRIGEECPKEWITVPGRVK